MTVKELLNWLSHQPEEQLVLSLGADEEYHEVKPRVTKVVQNNAGEFFEDKSGVWGVILQ